MGKDRVDWDRYIGVRSRAVDGTGETHTPLGDPTRWGAAYEVLVPPNPLTELKSQQIIRAQCTDAYARSWLMCGTLQASTLMWNAPDNWDAFLDVSFGVGQAVVDHRFDLKALCALALDSLVYVTVVNGNIQTRPWVISGGIFGQQVSARVALTLRGFDEANPQRVITTMAMAPLNAGTGL